MPVTTSQPAGGPAARSHRQPPDLWTRLHHFWQRVTEGMEAGQLWSQFRADARTSYRLYTRDFEAKAPGRSWRHDFLHTLQEFAWAILEKLTPARRVLLLIAVVLLLIPSGGFSYHNASGEVRALELDSHFYGGLLLFILMMLEMADRVVMKRDLEIARDIQRWLLPATPPAVPGLSIAFATRAANTVAGDYYDVFPRAGLPAGEPRFILAVADVAGKSIPAALLMATFQASLKTISATPCSLAELVAGMNQYACSNSQSGLRFTTAVLAEYEAGSRTLTYINAGHNAPIVRRSSGAIERLENGGLPLGIQAEAKYESGTLNLQPGDWLAIFTDGLVEAENAKQEEYGEARLLTNLQSGAGATPEELLRRIIADADLFVGDTPQHDDLTCVLVKASG